MACVSEGGENGSGRGRALAERRVCVALFVSVNKSGGGLPQSLRMFAARSGGDEMMAGCWCMLGTLQCVHNSCRSMFRTAAAIRGQPFSRYRPQY